MDIPAFAADWGPTGLLAFAVWMVLTGRLIPKATYDQQVQATAWYRDAFERRLGAIAQLLPPTADAIRSTMAALPRPQEPQDEKERGDP